MEKNPKSWERAFPNDQIDNEDWIAAVITDLANYCGENGRKELEKQLRALIHSEQHIAAHKCQAKRN